jgi:flavin-dependent dehydrogenase
LQRVETVIVGGGPAGIATALFLAHAAPGRTDRIVVLEKERYPREKFCAGGLGARADRLLGSIGAVVDVPSAPVDGVAFRARSGTLIVRDREIGRVVRRIEFDHELARIARRRGIRVIEGARVSGLEIANGYVDVQSSAGGFRASVVVGADGMGSVVRRAMGLGASRWQAQALEVDTEAVGADLPRDLLVFDASNRRLGGYYWEFPTVVDGRPLVCRGIYRVRRDGDGEAVEIQSLLERELEARGLVLARYRKKRFSERGFQPHVATSRPRVLLAGEAAGIDPVTGEGIPQALQYGALAGGYLARKLDERDLGFSDWPREVARSVVGIDLGVRELGARIFYGAHRAAVERFVVQVPDFVRAGLAYFAGQRVPRAALVAAGLRAVGHTARALWRGAESE